MPRLVAMLCLLTTFSSGCTSLRQWARQGFRVGPEYRTPPAPVSDEWIDFQRPEISNAPADHAQWWQVFGDPVLNRLVDQAANENLTLRAAGMRIMEARARMNIARGNLFPQLQEAFGEYFRQNTSQTGANIFPNTNFDTWNVGFNASWELDFWGRFRRAIEQQDALLDATIEDYDNVLVLLQAEIATAYIQYRTFQKRLEFAHKNVELQRRTMEIADVQFRNGKVTELDVAQAKENLAATEAFIPQLESGMRQAGNAICVLLGTPPRDLTEELGDGPIPIAPTEVIVGVPAELLRRRPDVRRAERLAAAQSAAIGIAESEFYPHIAISGSIGFGSKNLSDLFNINSAQGFIGPSFRWNILNYGRLINNVRANEALFYQRVLEYQQVVLDASQEVEDAMVGYVKRREELERLTESASQAERAVTISMTQYRRGRVNFQPVVYMQQILAGRQDQLTEIQGAVATELIDIYRALGGGWRARFGCPPNTFPPASSAPETDLPAPPELPPAEPTPAEPPAAEPTLLMLENNPGANEEPPSAEPVAVIKVPELPAPFPVLHESRP